MRFVLNKKEDLLKNVMKSITSIQEEFIHRFTAWEQSQVAQTEGYEYEKSFVEMWQSLGRELLERSSNKGNHSKKKSSLQWAK